MRIKYEVSAGGLLLRRRDSIYDALLIGRGDPPRVWTLPKGHVEVARVEPSKRRCAKFARRRAAGARSSRASTRSPTGFTSGKAKHRKAVTFFLMRYLSGDPANHDHEVDDARLVRFDAGAQDAQIRQREAARRSRARVSGRHIPTRSASPSSSPAIAETHLLLTDRSPHAFYVRLDAFDGPLDLLLGLIKEQQLDIATVPLASVAEQYLAYVRAMQARDVEIAAEYLVIAATLLFLKSKALLPPIPQEFVDEESETPEEVEERLRRRLIAYSKYRELGRRAARPPERGELVLLSRTGRPGRRDRAALRHRSRKAQARLRHDARASAPRKAFDRRASASR